MDSGGSGKTRNCNCAWARVLPIPELTAHHVRNLVRVDRSRRGLTEAKPRKRWPAAAPSSAGSDTSTRCPSRRVPCGAPDPEELARWLVGRVLGECDGITDIDPLDYADVLGEGGMTVLRRSW